MHPEASQPTSISLLRRAAANDQGAWRQLVHLYGPLVHRWCRRARLHDDDVADVFQETFRAVARRLPTFTPNHSVGSFRSWLRTIVRSKVTDHFRRLRRQPLGRGGTEAQVFLSNLPDPLAGEVAEDIKDDNALIVHRALATIRPEFSERNWTAFLQVAVQGRSATDVAAELDVAPQTVRQANYRIRRRLRVVLQDLVE